ncbi:hypothetical protein HHI36_011054, partial [Cryptolaemus montrouzieri]
VEESSSTSLIVLSTSHVDNPRILPTVQSGDPTAVTPTIPTSSKTVPKGIYVAGQAERKPRKKPTVLSLTSTPNIEEVKAKSSPPPVPTKKRERFRKH